LRTIFFTLKNVNQTLPSASYVFQFIDERKAPKIRAWKDLIHAIATKLHDL